jgi:hypothetical protein
VVLFCLVAENGRGKEQILIVFETSTYGNHILKIKKYIINSDFWLIMMVGPEETGKYLVQLSGENRT